MKLPLAVLIASLLLIFPPLYSQQKWRHLTTDDGLSGNKILTIYQAKDGDIWIGTDKGINRYNGIFEESSLSGSVNSILELPTGQIIARQIISSNNSSSVNINLYDGLEWDRPDFLADNAIIVSNMPQYVVVSGGKLWIATWDGLVGFDGTEWKLYDTDVDTDWLVKTPDGRLWSESWQRDSIVSFDGQKWNLKFSVEDSLLDEMAAITQTVLATSTAKILLGTNVGLFQYDPLLDSVTDLKLGKVNVGLIYESRDQSLWVATDKGLFQFTDGKWQQSIADQAINYIQQTDQGQLWVGTSNGLYHFDNGEWILNLDVAVNCFIELADGTFLVGGNDGLRLKPPADETVVMQTQLPGEFVSRLFLASDGTLWCRSTAGIFSYNGVAWINHGRKDLNLRQPNQDYRSNIYEDRNGVIWFNEPLLSFVDGSLNSHSTSGWTWGITETAEGHLWVTGAGGSYIYDGNDENRLARVSGRPTRGININEWAAYQDNDGSMWVNGTYGIWRFADGQWKEYHEQESRQVPGGNDFQRGPDGILWAGTGAGIYKLNADDKWEKVIGGEIRRFHLTTNGTLVAIDRRNGLLINEGQRWTKHPSYGSGRMYQGWFDNVFVEHPEGVFWLATNKGLRRIQGDFWYDLTIADGLPSNDVRSVEKGKQGNLWVGTDNGLVKFTSLSNLNPPAVQLIQIDGDYIRDDRIYKTGRAFVLVDWRGGDIETEPSRLQYQYNLDGQWSKLVKQNTATIGLENGEHQFSVRVIDHHFNTSPLEKITIIVETEAPYLKIVSPDSGDIVAGEQLIKGEIKDNDFKAFQVFLSDTELTDVPIWSDSETNLQGLYQLIFEADVRPKTATLAPLKTKSLDDGNYRIWLTAQDELEHSSFDKITVRVDNTRPSVIILTPKADERVLKSINILASASDIHLDSYRLDFSTSPDSKSWEQIYLRAGLYQKNVDGLLRKPELQTVEIKRDWEIPIPEGLVWIRLMATDIADNSSSQTIQVEVPAVVVTRKGGNIAPDDRQAELYFPPNTLPQDTIVTVNTWTDVEVEPPVRRVSQVYDFAPTTLRLNAIKPATLTISYDPSQLSAGKEPLIFHRTDGPWKAIGGTPNPEQQTISAAVLSLGQYALGEMDKIEALDSANLKPNSLTCQPRVFSPKGNSFSTTPPYLVHSGPAG